MYIKKNSLKKEDHSNWQFFLNLVRTCLYNKYTEILRIDRKINFTVIEVFHLYRLRHSCFMFPRGSIQALLDQ